jgi:hypothetical protein
MRELGAREFRTHWTSLTGEVVRVTSRGRVLGHWVPGDNPLRWTGERDGYEDEEDDVPIKKEIEKQAPKPIDGKLTTGMTELPQRGMTGAWGTSKPAPKPGKKS